jgi:prolyl 4-hydroxylase
MQGCYDAYGEESCDDYEGDRIVMSLRQPQSMLNYTNTGFKHTKAPENLWKILKNHWELNKDDMKEEVWPKGSVYTNHWVAPTHMVSVEDTSLRGGGTFLKNEIWDAAKPVIEEWTGMEVQPISLYGIRVYTEGAILSPHADRLPLVSSAIVNIAQDVDEDWVLEIYDRDGNAVNVTMEPGDMVLYESGSLIHGVSRLSIVSHLVVYRLTQMLTFNFTAPLPSERSLLCQRFCSLRTNWASLELG